VSQGDEWSRRRFTHHGLETQINNQYAPFGETEFLERTGNRFWSA
jgi:hypothetical protein